MRTADAALTPRRLLAIIALAVILSAGPATLASAAYAPAPVIEYVHFTPRRRRRRRHLRQLC